VLLHQSLPGGVRLRLPHRADADGLRALCARHRADCDPELLLRFDPRERAVICATEGIGAAETVVGVGAIAAGLGPASPENDIYHRVMAPLHALSLIWLATPTGRCAASTST